MAKHRTGPNRDHPHAYSGDGHHDAHIGGRPGESHLECAVEELRAQHSPTHQTGHSRPPKPQHSGDGAGGAAPNRTMPQQGGDHAGARIRQHPGTAARPKSPVEGY